MYVRLEKCTEMMYKMYKKITKVIAVHVIVHV